MPYNPIFTTTENTNFLFIDKNAANIYVSIDYKNLQPHFCPHRPIFRQFHYRILGKNIEKDEKSIGKKIAKKVVWFFRIIFPAFPDFDTSKLFRL